MESIAERAVRVAEEANKTARSYQDEILPTYFFVAYTLGESKIKFDKLENKELGLFLKEIYEKGKEIASKSIKTTECPKCHKAVSKEEGSKFCQFCGSKLD